MSFSLSSSYWYIHVIFKLNWYKRNNYIQTGNKATWYISDFQVIQMQNNKQNCNANVKEHQIQIEQNLEEKNINQDKR